MNKRKYPVPAMCSLVGLVCALTTLLAAPWLFAADCTPIPIFERLTLELVETEVDGEASEVSQPEPEFLVQMNLTGELVVFEGESPTLDSLFLEPVSDLEENP